ncbi:MAG: DUF1573 domain-containing protein [Bacteroidales bacterium]|nr:DUF1573 domain-containing protein [Bacteroidales bacterium]
MRLGIFVLLYISSLLVIAQGVKIDIPDSIQNKTIQTPRIEFAEREYDFGRFEPIGNDTLKVYTFRFTNTGQKPLVILRAVSSCGCTLPTYTKEPIMPGDSGIVTVGYRGHGQPFGYFRKSITVYTNDPRSFTRIFIKGEIVKKN